AWGPNRLGSRLTVGMLALACSLGSLGALSAASANASMRVSSTQRLAVLLYQHDVYRSPRSGAPIVASVTAHRPITGEQTTLPVIRRMNIRHGIHWLKVMLPGRPNSSTGWIHRGGTRALVTNWHIVVSTSARRVWVYYHGGLARTFPAVVGKPSTPTPTGKFFVEETVTMPSSMPGGPFALALSARSNVLQEFDGGPGQIAMHGRDGLGGNLGQAESHGCMRLATETISWLAARIGPGVPVDIR
ncbi:MAG: L,D-transpeptidase, partial [Candidatus Dormibacteraeota bacterium]|nr:L,D-transpeptidase [Candidatus Dormibacteraeota bacterium]